MAHPKRRQSETRGNKRRTHDVVVVPRTAKGPITGENHLCHRAHWYEEKLYYRGQVLIDNTRNAE